MKMVRTEDAVGQVLCHDITRIVKGVVKDAVFRKGHIVRPEDVPVLLSIGKDHLYIWENDESMLHENDAAEVLCSICRGSNLDVTAVKEGKIELVAQCDGLLMVDVERLRAVNSLGNMMIATLPSGFVVKRGQHVAGTRIIPLVIKKAEMERARRAVGMCSGGEEGAEKYLPIVNVMPLKAMKYGVVTTGNEVFNHRIEDTFTPTIVEKLAEFGCEMVAHEVSDDNNINIEKCIGKLVSDERVEMIVCTGGMSVDPDDRTPLAIKNSGARIVSYGSPVLPGAMFLMGYLADGRPIMGLPGCVMYARRTVFDLVLPRVLAGVSVTAEYLAGLGNGGMCQNCEVCHFPNCGFGKGL